MSTNNDRNHIAFFIPGEPKRQSRPRATVIGGHARIYQPKPKEWRQRIAALSMEHRPAQPLTGPVRVDCLFVFPRPKSHFGTGRNARRLKPSAPHWHTITVDRDNLEKALLDELQECGFFRNDSQVCCGPIQKIWEQPRIRPGAYIMIRQLDDDVLPYEVRQFASQFEECAA